MKKSLVLLTLLTVLLLTVLPVSAIESGKSFGQVLMIPDGVTIDGEKDYAYDQSCRIDITLPDDPNVITGTTGAGYVLWNGSDTLYVYVEIKDKEVLVPNGSEDKPWHTDSVEVFIDYTNTNGRERDQYRIDAAGAPTYYNNEIATSIFKDGVGKYGFEEWAAKKISGGYAVEFQIKAYNEPIKAGMKLGFDICVNDVYTGAESEAIYCAASSQESKGNPNYYDFIELSGTEVEYEEIVEPAAGAAAGSVVAARTADASVLALVSMILSCGAAYVCGKRR